MDSYIPFIAGGLLMLAISLILPLWLERRRDRGRWDDYYREPTRRKRDRED